jgi:hypothetical protein
MRVNFILLHRRAKQWDAAAHASEVASLNRIPSIEERMLKLAGPRHINDKSVMPTGPMRAAVPKRSPIEVSQGLVIRELRRDVRIWNAGQPGKASSLLRIDLVEKEVEKSVHLSPPPKPDNYHSFFHPVERTFLRLPAKMSWIIACSSRTCRENVLLRDRGANARIR